MTRRKATGTGASPRVRASPLPAGAAQDPSLIPPYPPSWFDRLSARIDRLPISPYVVYVLFGLVSFIALTLAQWAGGEYPPGEFRGFHAFLAFLLPLNLALMHYLDHLAANALETFRPALAATPEEAHDLQYRVTTLPARTAARIASAVVLANILLVLIDHLILRLSGEASMIELAPNLFQVAATPFSLALTGALVLALWWISGTFIYHTVHQLRVISRIYSRHTRLRLLHLGPLYTFSRVTQRTAIGILVAAYAFLSSAAGFREQPALFLASGIVFGTIAAATFAWPLLGVHRLLVAEKERRLDENTRRLETGIADLHGRMDRRRLSRMDDLNKALASLDLERAMLARIPTWPWDPGTLRGLVAALLVPLIIWLIQLGAERLLP